MCILAHKSKKRVETFLERNFNLGPDTSLGKWNVLFVSKRFYITTDAYCADQTLDLRCLYNLYDKASYNLYFV